MVLTSDMAGIPELIISVIALTYVIEHIAQVTLLTDIFKDTITRTIFH